MQQTEVVLEHQQNVESAVLKDLDLRKRKENQQLN
jgi:hypothetical protein